MKTKNMDLENAFNIFLHKLLDKFIALFETYIQNKQVDSTKISIEIIKRSLEISRELKMIASGFQAQMKISSDLFFEKELNGKLENLVQRIFLQDLMECALVLPDVSYSSHISSDDLHKYLYLCIKQHGTLLMPSSVYMAGSFGFPLTFSHLFSTSSLLTKKSCLPKPPKPDENLKCVLPSVEFQKSSIQFENDITEFKHILECGFYKRDLSAQEINPLLKSDKKTNEESSHDENCKYERKQTDGSQGVSSQPAVSDLDLFSDVITDEEPSFLSWEGCLGGFLPNHLYISESIEETYFIGDKEHHNHQFIKSMPGTISKDNLVHHCLDLLVGIPSSTFHLDNSSKFRMEQGIHLQSLSVECTSRLLSDFLESGNVFYALQKFSSYTFGCEEGLIMKGLKMGVRKILCLYTEFISSVKMNTPDLYLLRTNVLKNAQLIIVLGNICSINSETYMINEIPKGLCLITHLHSAASSHKQKEYAVMMSVLLKYTYDPYLNFLNKWMTEGLCCDPYDEFQIVEDPKYLDYRDSLYWKYAYTEIKDSPSRSVPYEIEKFSQGILDCGKSIQLLKLCCPELFSLKFIFFHPPPPLSMVFSYHAASTKTKECSNYINLKEEAEKYSALSSQISDDQICANYQRFVYTKLVFKNVEEKWKTLISTVKNTPEIHFNTPNCDSNIDSFFHHVSPLKRWNSYENIAVKSEQYGFSGILLQTVGLLFTSHGYTERNFSYHQIIENESFDSESLHSFKNKCTKKSVNPLVNSVTHYKLNPFSKIYQYTHPSTMSHLYPNESDAIKGTSQDVEFQSMEISAGSFLDKLISLLVTHYGETKEEIYFFIQSTSLQRLIFHNFSSILNVRIHLVEKIISKYIVHQLGLNSLLKKLRDIYCFQDEGFSQYLCQQLFNLVSRCNTPHQFTNWAVLNEILTNAVLMSSNGNETSIDYVSVNVMQIPDNIPLVRTDFLRLFYIQYEVSWPLNIIIHSACIKHYMSIFSVMLEMEYLCWMLGKCWRKLLIEGKKFHLEDNPEYRKILFIRFDMDQFIRALHNSIRGQLQGSISEPLSKGLHAEEMSIDALEELHVQYLEKILARCFLTEETNVMHELISVMFCQVFKFCSEAIECQWDFTSFSENYETASYSNLCSFFDVYKQYQNVFLQRIIKEALTKKFGRIWDKDYCDFLEAISQFKTVDIS